MIKQSDYIITYVTHNWGGAANFKSLAEKKGKNNNRAFNIFYR